MQMLMYIEVRDVPVGYKALAVATDTDGNVLRTDAVLGLTSGSQVIVNEGERLQVQMIPQ